MPTTTDGWAVKSKDGDLTGFRRTRLEVERIVVGTYYPGTLEGRYREMFETELFQKLDEYGSTIVRARMTIEEVEQ